MSSFIASCPLPVSAAQAYAWHARPGALERLCPPAPPVRVLSRDAGLYDGARVLLELRLGPLRPRWLAIHQEVEAGRSFSDIQARGPFASWHHAHRFLPGADAAACQLQDAVTYRLPGGRLASWLAEGMAARSLARTFAWRHRRLQEDLARHAGGRPLRIAISGATGLVGAACLAFLAAAGHTVLPLQRPGSRPAQLSGVALPSIRWDPLRGEVDAIALASCDAVIHLAGASIADGRWTPAIKARLRSSRIAATRHLTQALAGLSRPPGILICASAVGAYGERGDTLVDEASAPGSGFLADLCREWEAAADPARAAGIRVVHLRFGMILAAGGGALPRLLLPFRLGVGGRLGSGQQWVPWIALDDVLGMVACALRDPAYVGVINACAPQLMTNRAITTDMARLCHRPAWCPVPAWAIRTLLGEMGDSVLLASQRVQPTRLQTLGFRFTHPAFKAAAAWELGWQP